MQIKEKPQSSLSLAFVRGIHRWPMNSSHKGPVTRIYFHLMTSSYLECQRKQWGFYHQCSVQRSHVFFLFMSQPVTMCSGHTYFRLTLIQAWKSYHTYFRLTLIQAWISNHTLQVIWGEFAYPFQTSINEMDVITYPLQGAPERYSCAIQAVKFALKVVKLNV